METSGQCPQNSTSARPPRLYPPLPVNTDGKGEENTGIRQRLRSAKEQEERTPLQMPIRELQQPPVQEACGHHHQPPVAYYYQPISSMDVLNWQRHAPLYLGEPQAMIRLMETVFRTHRPMWDDTIPLLVSLLSSEERHRTLTEARKWFRELAPGCRTSRPRRAGIATVAQWKGGATWGDIGGYLTRSPGGPENL